MSLLWTEYCGQKSDCLSDNNLNLANEKPVDHELRACSRTFESIGKTETSPNAQSGK